MCEVAKLSQTFLPAQSLQQTWYQNKHWLGNVCTFVGVNAKKRRTNLQWYLNERKISG